MTVSGSGWDRRQRVNESEGGHRSYKVCKSFQDAAPQIYVDSATDLMVTQGHWEVLPEKTLVVQTRIARMQTRGIATMRQLLTSRNTNHPNRGFWAVIEQDADELERMKKERCRLDAYWENTLNHYDGDKFNGPDMRTEAKAVAKVADTDSIPVERLHSRNQRQSKSRVWGHAFDLPTLSAYAVSAQARSMICKDGFEGKRKKDARAKQKASRLKTANEKRIRKSKKEGAKGQRRRAEETKPRPMGPWRAFISEKRVKVDANNTSLSEEYRNLSSEEMERLAKMGDLATDSKKSGNQAFGFRMPRSQENALKRSTANVSSSSIIEESSK